MVANEKKKKKEKNCAHCGEEFWLILFFAGLYHRIFNVTVAQTVCSIQYLRVQVYQYITATNILCKMVGSLLWLSRFVQYTGSLTHVSYVKIT